MTVNVSKPALNVREKLAELDYARLPYQKAPAGSIIQVDHYKKDGNGTPISTTSQSYVDSGISLTFYPKFANSKLLVRAFAQVYVSANHHGKIAIYRDDTDELVQTSVHWDNSSTDLGASQGMIEALDNAATTEAVKYSIYFLIKGSSGQAVINGESYSDAGITVMEIAQ